MATPAPVNQHNQMRARIARCIHAARASIDPEDLKVNAAYKKNYAPNKAISDALIREFAKGDMLFMLEFSDEKEQVLDGQLAHLVYAIAIDFETGEKAVIASYKMYPVEFGGGYTNDVNGKNDGKPLKAVSSYSFAVRPLLLFILGISADEVASPEPLPASPQSITESKPAATDLPPLPPVSVNPTFAELRGFAAGFKVKNYAMPAQEYLDFLSKLEQEANQDGVSEKDFISIIMNKIEQKAKQMGKTELPHIRDIIHRI